MEDLEILIMTLYSNCKTQNEVFLISSYPNSRM